MVALGLLAFGILGITAGQLAAMKTSTNSREASVALYLAEQQMETFQAMSATDVAALAPTPNDPANPIDPDPGDGNSTTYNRSWQIQPDTPEAGVIALTIQVDWVDAVGTTRSQWLYGFKADL